MTPTRLLAARCAAAALCAAATLAFACNDDSGDDPDATATIDPAATASATPRPLASVVGTTTIAPTPEPGTHDDALITADELGEGWDAYPTAGAEPAAQDYCGVRIEPLPVDSFATFINTDAKRTLYHAITTLESEDAAADYIERLSEAIHDCEDWTSGEGERVTNWKTTGVGTELPFGDSSIEQVATTQLPDRMSPSATYSIVVRDGATVMIVSMFMDGAPDDTAFPIAQYAWEKLTGETISEG